MEHRHSKLLLARKKRCCPIHLLHSYTCNRRDVAQLMPQATCLDPIRYRLVSADQDGLRDYSITYSNAEGRGPAHEPISRRVGMWVSLSSTDTPPKSNFALKLNKFGDFPLPGKQIIMGIVVISCCANVRRRSIKERGWRLAKRARRGWEARRGGTAGGSRSRSR